MNAIEVIRQTLKKSNPEQIAAALGVSVSTLHKWSEAGESHRPNPLERVETLVKSTEDLEPLRWLCEQFGGYFVPNPKHDGHRPKSLPEEENRLMTDVGAMIGLLGRVARKKEITRGEAAEMRAEWERLKSLTEYFVVCCEQGAF